MVLEISFEKAKLSSTNLIPYAVYLGKSPNRHGNRPLDAIFKGIVDINGENEQAGLDSGGGIRTRYVQGRTIDDKIPAFIVIRNTKEQKSYPNNFDIDSGILTYYGDNTKKNHPLETRKKGNRNLKRIFDYLQYRSSNHDKYICPIFYFESVNPGSVEQKFMGMAYPYVVGKEYSELISEVTVNNVKNFKFQFTIVPSHVNKQWLYELLIGNKGLSENAPESWNNFVSQFILSDSIHFNKHDNSELLNESREKYVIQTSTRKSESNTRVGQNEIRKELLKQRKCCEICGISNPNILIASHILPWKDFKDKRGNLFNVLLLCANHDKLLDRKLITFSPETGKIKISKQIKSVEYLELNINPNFKLPMTIERKEIFKEHIKIFQRT